MEKFLINGELYSEKELRRGYRVLTGLDDEDLSLDQLVEYMKNATESRVVNLTKMREMVESFDSVWEAAKAARTRSGGVYSYLTDVLAASALFTSDDWKENMLSACNLVASNFGLSLE